MVSRLTPWNGLSSHSRLTLTQKELAILVSRPGTHVRLILSQFTSSAIGISRLTSQNPCPYHSRHSFVSPVIGSSHVTSQKRISHVLVSSSLISFRDISCLVLLEFCRYEKPWKFLKDGETDRYCFQFLQRCAVNAPSFLVACMVLELIMDLSVFSRRKFRHKTWKLPGNLTLLLPL